MKTTNDCRFIRQFYFFTDENKTDFSKTILLSSVKFLFEKLKR